MWKNSKKWLALLLALTMTSGEFLPAYAAAPDTVAAETESTAQTVTEEESESPAAGEKTEEADAKQGSMAEEPAQKQPQEQEESTELLEAEGSAEVSMQNSAASDSVETVELTEWNWTGEVAGDQTIRFIYKPERQGDYLLAQTEGIDVSAASDTTTLHQETLENKEWNVFSCVKKYEVTQENTTIEFQVTNISGSAETLTFATDQSLHAEKVSLGQAYYYEQYGTPYFSYTAEEAGFYYLTNVQGEATDYIWAYIEEAQVNSGLFSDDAGIYLEEGQTLHFKSDYTNTASNADTVQIRKTDSASAEGTHFTDGATADGKLIWEFRPTESGKYYAELGTDGNGEDLRFWGESTWQEESWNTWKDWSWDTEKGQYYLELETGRTYYILAKGAQVYLDIDSISDGTYLPVKQGDWSLTVIPKESGYYGLTDGVSLSAWQLSEEGQWMDRAEIIPVVRGSRIQNYVKLEKGATYRITVEDRETAATERFFEVLKKLPTYPVLEEAGGSLTLPAGQAGCYEFPKSTHLVISSDKNSRIDTVANSDVYLQNSISIQNIVWSEFQRYDINGTCYLTVESSKEAQTITWKPDFDYTPVEDWQGDITLEPGETKLLSYSTDEIGDYLIKTDGDQVTCTDGGDTYSWGRKIDDIWYYGITKSWDENSIKIILTNNDRKASHTVTLIRDKKMPIEEVTLDSDDVQYDDGAITYYTFRAPKSGCYSLKDGSVNWVIKNDDRSHNWSWSLTSSGGIWMKKDDQIRFAVASYTVDGSVIRISEVPYEEVTGSRLVIRAEADAADWQTHRYAFTPTETGTYYVGGSVEYVRMWDTSQAQSEWCTWIWNDAGECSEELQAGVTYYLEVTTNGDYGTISRGSGITVLDYDYYDAFITSGGSVTVDDLGKVTIDKGKANWTLKSFFLSIYNTFSSRRIAYAEDWDQVFQKVNAYWKKASVGGFKATDFYRLKEDGTTEEINGYQYAEDGDVILVKYKPETVWTASLTVTAADGKTTIPAGETLELTAHPKADTTKYDFPDGYPQLRWESSDPEIAEVDPETGEVTTLSEGKVTITAYADEEQRASCIEQGRKMPKYTAGSITLNVTKKKEAPGKLIVEPEKTDWVLPAVGGVVQFGASLRTEPASVILDSSKVTWHIEDAETGSTAACTYEPWYGSFRIKEAGTYRIYAECKIYGKTYGRDDQNEVLIHVTREKKAFPIAAVDPFYVFSNVDGTVTFGDLSSFLEEKFTLPEDAAGHFVYTDAKGKELKTTTKLVKGINTWNVSYVPGEEDAYAAASTAVSIEYGALSVKLSSKEGTTLAAAVQSGTEQMETGTAYPMAAYVEPVYYVNGKEADEQKLKAGFGQITALNLSANKEGILSLDSENGEISGIKAGKAGVTAKVTVSGISGKEIQLTSSLLNFTVKDESARAVGSISVTGVDGYSYNPNSEGVEAQRVLAEDQIGSQAFPLTVEKRDCAGELYDEAKVTWKTSDKAVAYVAAAKNGTATLIVPKGASGTAELTVTANDYHKASCSFKIVVADADVRLGSSTVTLNSQSTEWAELQVMANTLWAEAAGIQSGNLAVEVVPDESQSSRFEFDNEDGEYNGVLVDPYWGTVYLRYASPDEKAGKTTLNLTILCYDKSYDKDSREFEGKLLRVEKKITVVNKPSVPKTTAKVTKNYNTFWSGEEAYAEVVLTAGEPIKEGPAPRSLEPENRRQAAISLRENASYEIAKIELLDEDTNQWKVLLKAKTDKPKKTALTFDVEYASGYRKAAQAKATVSAVSQSPSFAVKADGGFASFYPELGEDRVQVLLQVAEGIELDDITLTAAAAKNFELDKEHAKIVAADTEDDGRTAAEMGGYVAILPVRSRTGKTGDIQFSIKTGDFAKENAVVLSKKLRITARKLSTEKVVLYDAYTYKEKTTGTLQQMQAGKEILNLAPEIPYMDDYDWYFYSDEYEENILHDYYVSLDGADKFTEEMLQKGYLKVEQDSEDGYLIQAAPELFTQKTSACKLKFTFYANSSEGDGAYHLVKAVTVKLNLQKQKQVPKITATMTVKGSLNVVQDTSVSLIPAFKNLPAGTKIVDAAFADPEDKKFYEIYYVDTSTGNIELEADGESRIPIGKNKVGFVYSLRQTDGTISTVPVTATINVVQTAAVKADTKAITLYNAAAGAAYGTRVGVTVSKPEGAAIGKIEVQGLEGSGISYYDDWRDDNQIDLWFYVDGQQNRGLTKNYSVKLIVHLENAGTKNGKEVTYTLPVTVTLKK